MHVSEGTFGEICIFPIVILKKRIAQNNTLLFLSRELFSSILNTTATH